MSNLSTLPKGDSAWLLRKAIERIMQQISVLETNIGSSTTGNSANTQIIFNDAGTLRGDAGLTYNKTTDTLTAGAATITGDLTVRTNKLKVDASGVGIGTTATTTGGGICCIQHASNNGLVIDATAGNPTLYLRNTVDTTPAKIMFTDNTGLLIANVSSTLATFSSSGNLGIGVTPTYKFQSVGIAAATDASFNGSGGNLIGALLNSDDANSGANPGVDLRRWTGTAFNHGTSYIATNSAGDTLFYNGAVASNTRATSLKMTLNASGNLVFPSGKGIDFSAVTGGTGTATGNVLNDYEEGTFVPTVIGSTTAGTGDYPNRKGFYTKVGRIVTVNVWLQWTSHSGTGNMSFSGLPFIVQNIAGNYGGVSIGYVSNIGLTAGNVLYGLTEYGTQNITANQTPTGGGTYSLVPIDTSAEIAFTATYMV